MSHSHLSAIAFFLLLISLTTSCDRPDCKNTNHVFDQFAPDTGEYKAVLSKQMKAVGQENLRYWFDKGKVEGEKEIYELHVQGPGLCAKLVVENKTVHKILHKGGFRGAELKGVLIKTVQDSVSTNFILEKIGDIID